MNVTEPHLCSLDAVDARARPLGARACPCARACPLPARACLTSCANGCPGCGGLRLGSVALPRRSSPKSQPISTLPGASPLATAICLMRRCLRTLTRPSMGIYTTRRHADAWFEWRSRGWLSLGSGFEYRTGNGSSTLTPDPSSALLKKSPQADIVRRTIITDDRECAHQGGRPESRGQLRQGSEASRVHRGGCGCGVESHEVRRGHMGGKD